MVLIRNFVCWHLKRADRQLPDHHGDRACLSRDLSNLEDDTTLMKEFIATAVALALAVLMSLTAGCGANFFSAKTTAIYEITPDGKRIEYSSNKEQQGLSLNLEEDNGKIKVVKINVDKSGTAEQAIAAALAVQIQMNDLLAKLLPLLEKAAITGAS